MLALTKPSDGSAPAPGRAAGRGPCSLGMGSAGFPPPLFVSLGISQASENNTSLAGRDLGAGCQPGLEFFEISESLKTIIMVGRCEKLFKIWHVSSRSLK